MTVFISKQDDSVIVLARPESPGIFGDAIWKIKPGQSAFGYSYEWWSQQPVGRLEIKVPHDRPDLQPAGPDTL